MSMHSSWAQPLVEPELAAGSVHVWRAHLTQPPLQMERLYGILGPEERDRAQRFRFEHDRRRFVVAHGALREILASYLGHDPAELRFRRDPGGKPALTGMAGGWLFFNLSHSEDLALIALALRRRVGVDVEKFRDVDLGIARRYFSQSEIAAIALGSPEEQQRTFFSFWTLKEAYLKAIGTGLSLPLDGVVVSLHGSPSLVKPSNSPWTLRLLDPSPGYVGALAVDGEITGLHCWEYQEPDIHIALQQHQSLQGDDR